MEEKAMDLNPFRQGISSIDELEEKVRAFRVMNQSAMKKRYLLSKEQIISPSGEIILDKGGEIDLAVSRNIRRNLIGTNEIKTYQPDEDLIIVTDFTTDHGIKFSMNMVAEIMKLSGGRYESFITRVDSIFETLELLMNTLFPRVVLIGYIPVDIQEVENLNFIRLKRMDPFVRIMEVTDSEYKKKPIFPGTKQIAMPENNEWTLFMKEIIHEYAKPYFVEDF